MSVEFPSLQPFYEKVFDETVSDKEVAAEIEFVSGFFEEWVGNFLHPLGDDLLDGNQSESILYCYMASQSLNFDWMSHTLLLGNYQVVLRELRSILENLFYMFYLDVNNKGKTVEEKYMVLEKQELSNGPHGKPVFRNSGYSNWESCYDLYRRLCKYIHIHTRSSGKFALEVAKKGFPEALDVKYSRESFIECSKTWRELAKIAGSLAGDLLQKLGVGMEQFNPNHFA